MSKPEVRETLDKGCSASSIEPSLRHISHQLDRIVIDTQNIKSDLMYIKLYIDTQKQKNQTHSNDEISKGWFFNHR